MTEQKWEHDCIRDLNGQTALEKLVYSFHGARKLRFGERWNCAGTALELR
jgi:hypothetical protein